MHAPPTATAPPAELLPLLSAEFVLTDARGGITRFGPSAQRLFGARPDEALGRSVFDVLLAPGEGAAQRAFLENGAGDPARSRLTARGRHGDGHSFEVELTILPVPLSESLEISRLLEAIGAGGDDRWAALERDHAPAIVQLANAADRSLADSDARLAGLIVCFRATEPAPWADRPAESEAGIPEPARPEPAVAPGDELLVRLGELERDNAGTIALHEEVGRLRSDLERVSAEAATAAEAAAAAAKAAEEAIALAHEARLEAERWRAAAGADATERGSAPESNGSGGRAQREGFDDAERPMAVLALDGRFEFLNGPFEQLVGYGEPEFRRARWPSLVDRENLVAHRGLLAQLAAGEIEHADIDTVYLHGQGLIVPLHARIRLVRDEAGKPGHLLLEATA